MEGKQGRRSILLYKFLGILVIFQQHITAKILFHITKPLLAFRRAMTEINVIFNNVAYI
jgi:hypothetical protein